LTSPIALHILTPAARRTRQRWEATRAPSRCMRLERDAQGRPGVPSFSRHRPSSNLVPHAINPGGPGAEPPTPVSSIHHPSTMHSQVPLRPMQRLESQHEIFLVAKTVRLPEQDSDLVVHPLHRAAGYPQSKIGQNALAVPTERGGHFLHLLQLAGLCLGNPIPQVTPRRLGHGLAPQHSQVFLQIIRCRQWTVHLQGLIQPFPFALLVPTRPFEIDVLRAFKQ